MPPSKDPLDQLKTELWRKVIGTSEFVHRKSYYERIVEAIQLNTGEKIHWQTIRNFYQGKNQPNPHTLDIISTFLIGSSEAPKTFQHFVETKTGETKQNPGLKLKKWLPVILLLFAVLLGWYLYSDNSETQEFSATFRHNTIVRPWSVWNVDSAQLSHFSGINGLHLGTFLGDSYLTNLDYEPIVNNIITRPIHCGDCCEITVTIRDFNPYQRYQQAVFYLFYGKEGIEIPSLRYGFGNSGTDNLVDIFLRDGVYSNHRITSSNLPLRRISKVSNETPDHLIDSIALILRIDHGQYSFGYRVDDEALQVPILSQILDLPAPTYLGLAAFQGRPDVPFPVRPVADTLHVTFSAVKLQGCSEK